MESRRAYVKYDDWLLSLEASNWSSSTPLYFRFFYYY